LGQTLKHLWMKHEKPVLNKQSQNNMQRHRKIHPQAGFSLLEMLVVISLLAATAYVATGAYTGFIEDSQEQLVFTEMQEIAAAIRQFKQDTGYYPKTGPFDLGTTATTEVTDAEISALGTWTGTTAAARSNWFKSPANFYQILTAPLLSNHVSGLETWNAETGRGWRGPYLTGVKDGFVDVIAGLDPTDTSSTTGAIDVVGVADPFIAPHINVTGGQIMDWTRQAGTTEERVEKWGRPYLFFHDDNGTPTDFSDDICSLISMGPDGDYDNGIPTAGAADEDNDNITITFEQN
jgi:prepilin-type N-terminal cleavage/methylation domain-containing protein